MLDTVREVSGDLPIPAKNSIKLPWFVHGFIILLIDILLVYYLAPAKALLCLGLSFGLWWMTWEDYIHREVDIRVCGIVFLTGLMIYQENGSAVVHLYLGILGFLILHVLHEAFAIAEKADTKNGEIAYQAKKELDVNKAPAYLPIFIGSMILILGYYLLGLPLSQIVYFIVFSPFPDVSFPVLLWSIPFVFCLASLYFYKRNKKKMAQGYNIVYRGVGDGDIYFLGAMIGVLGFFLTFLTVFISLFPAGFFIRKWEKGRNTDTDPE